MGRDSKGRLRTEFETVSIKIRLDKATAEKLEECSERLEIPKAEVLRRGVHRIHEDLPKE
ncbi:hypothetical protein FACS189425_10400 [Clostridia bacterium]|nr:hypothetical protein FACS189425_10400 [Clostridia bacterium]